MTDKGKSPVSRIVALCAVVLVSFSSLLVFSDRIASKPTQAGFWLILVFGFTLGAAIVGIPALLARMKK